MSSQLAWIPVSNDRFSMCLSQTLPACLWSNCESPVGGFSFAVYVRVAGKVRVVLICVVFVCKELVDPAQGTHTRTSEPGILNGHRDSFP